MNPLPSSESSQDTTESNGSSFQEICRNLATYMKSDSSSDDDYILSDEFGSLSDTDDLEEAFEEVLAEARKVHGITSNDETESETEAEEEKPAETTEQETENETVKEAENTKLALQENTILAIEENTTQVLQDNTVKDLQDDTMQDPQDVTKNDAKKLNHMIEKYMKTRINYKIRIIDNNFNIFDGILRKVDEFHNLHFEEILKYINPLEMDSYDDVGNSMYLDEVQINSQDIMSFEVKEKVQARLPSRNKRKGSYKRALEILSTSDSDSDFNPLAAFVSQRKKPNSRSPPKPKNSSDAKPNNRPGPSKEPPNGKSFKMD